jgi:4,5-dihydroxyphthalate decarboxylase
MARTPFMEALFNGSVQPEGISLTCQSEFTDGLDNVGERHKLILGGKLAGGECSTSSFYLAIDRGVPLVALPVFPARSFPQRQIFCHVDAGIQTPKDLEGKRVTVHRWHTTSPTWTKGLLENEYGVALRNIDWYTAEDDPEGEEAPSDFRVQRIPEPASRERAVEMLEAGELDAGLDPYIHPGPTVRRVLDDWHAEAAAWFKRVGIYPMSHTIVLQRRIVDENPWIAQSLLEAFRESRQLASRYLTGDALAHEQWLESVLDDDPHICRLGPVERRTLAELVRYQLQQGLRTSPLDPPSLFATDGNS